jgi:hypothetical protein
VPQIELLEDRTVPSSFSFTTLDDPNAGTGAFQGTQGLGINASGQIVGEYFDSNSDQHGFLLSHGQYTTLDDPSAANGPGQGTIALGINSRGQIVGLYVDANYFWHGFMLSGGQYTHFDPPGALYTAPFGISNSGQISGYYLDGNSVYHGFLLNHGHYTILNDPNAGSGAFQGTAAYHLNSSGDVVGAFIDANSNIHGFRFSGGQYTTLDDPSAVGGTQTVGINSSGRISGFYFDANSVVHGFLLNQGQYSTLDDPNGGAAAGQGTYPFDINESGKITGYYLDANNINHGFLATPEHGSVPLGSDAVASHPAGSGLELRTPAPTAGSRANGLFTALAASDGARSVQSQAILPTSVSHSAASGAVSASQNVRPTMDISAVALLGISRQDKADRVARTSRVDCTEPANACRHPLRQPGHSLLRGHHLRQPGHTLLRGWAGYLNELRALDYLFANAAAQEAVALDHPRFSL